MTEIELFLDEIIEVCKKHGLSISHEDEQGAFLIEDYDEEMYSNWLRQAIDNRQ